MKKDDVTTSGISPEAKAALLELRQWRKSRPSESAGAEEHARSHEWMASILDKLARHGPEDLRDRTLSDAERHRETARVLREKSDGQPSE